MPWVEGVVGTTSDAMGRVVMLGDRVEVLISEAIAQVARQL